jgi:hypothetical protein
MQDICGTDGLTFGTNKTRFAAALLVLDFGLVEKLIPPGPIVYFEFEPALNAGELYRGWQDFDQWQRNNPEHPMTYMHKAAEARKWIVKCVVNGHHNEQLALPVQTYKTHNLNLATCLVANDFYLLKLEKTERRFHFPMEAEAEINKYRNPQPDSPYFWQSQYLHTYEWLLRCITTRKLTRQPKKQTVTS